MNLERQIINKYLKIYFDPTEVILLQNMIKSIQKNNGNELIIAKLKMKEFNLKMNQEMIDEYIKFLPKLQHDILYMKYKLRANRIRISMQLDIATATLSRLDESLMQEIKNLIYMKVSTEDYLNVIKLKIIKKATAEKIVFLSQDNYRNIIDRNQFEKLKGKYRLADNILKLIDYYIDLISEKKIDKRHALREYTLNNKLKLKELAYKYNKTIPAINLWIKELNQKVTKKINT